MTNLYPYFNRDLSWLSFNYRVLQEAQDETVPLYERIRFLAIYSSNLDEFFRVKVAALRSLLFLKPGQLKENSKALSFDPARALDAILQEVNRQQEEFGQTWREKILPALRAQNIILYQGEPVREEHWGELKRHFRGRVLSFLQPVFIREGTAVDYFLENRALYFVVELRDAEGREQMAYLNIPSGHLPRYIQLSPLEGRHYIIPLDELIRLNLPLLFPGYTIGGCYAIKLNRDEDIAIDDEFTGDLVKKIKEQLEKRKTGFPTRFLYDSAMPPPLLQQLIAVWGLNEKEAVPGGRYHNLFDLMKLPNPLKPELEYPPRPAIYIDELEACPSLLGLIAQKDIALHFPYHSYDYVLRFFNEAAIDPDVLEIKATLYRIAGTSLIASALISAARNGKKVTVFVEVKARFDEANNLRWAEQMEQAGIHIIYSIPGLKVHAKTALVKRREAGGAIRHYLCLATGNFNESTAGIYADHALFTCHEGMAAELDELFRYLKSRKEPGKFKHLLVARFNMKKHFLKLIDREMDQARKGKPAYILVKMNGLEEKDMIDKLYEAAQAGVKVDCIVRGICALVPQLPGISQGIRVFRLVDRYLEHARVFIFHNGGEEEIFLSSADWMNRNLGRRIEVGFPVYDEKIKADLKKIIAFQLQDVVKLRELDADQHNLPVPVPNGMADAAQEASYQFLKTRQETVAKTA